MDLYKDDLVKMLKFRSDKSVKKKKIRKSKEYTVSVEAESVMRKGEKSEGVGVANVDYGSEFKDSKGVIGAESKGGSDVRKVEGLNNGLTDSKVARKGSKDEITVNSLGMVESKRYDKKSMPKTFKRSKSKEKIGSKVNSDGESDFSKANLTKVRKGTRSLEDLERLVDGPRKGEHGTKHNDKINSEQFSDITSGYAGGLASVKNVDAGISRFKHEFNDKSHFEPLSWSGNFTRDGIGVEKQVSGNFTRDGLGVEKQDTEDLKEVKPLEIGSKIGSEKSTEGSDLLWDVSNDWMVRLQSLVYCLYFSIFLWLGFIH